MKNERVLSERERIRERFLKDIEEGEIFKIVIENELKIYEEYKKDIVRSKLIKMLLDHKFNKLKKDDEKKIKKEKETTDVRFICSGCGKIYDSLPLGGKCLECGGKILFLLKDGKITEEIPL